LNFKARPARGASVMKIAAILATWALTAQGWAFLVVMAGQA